LGISYDYLIILIPAHCFSSITPFYTFLNFL
jgi:hypothetical protein